MCLRVGQADRAGKGCPGRRSQRLTRIEFLSLKGQQEDRMGSPESKEESGRNEARGQLSQATFMYSLLAFCYYTLHITNPNLGFTLKIPVYWRQAVPGDRE